MTYSHNSTSRDLIKKGIYHQCFFEDVVKNVITLTGDISKLIKSISWNYR